ncbi:MAG: GAF domain-containing sensor histidine kinase [Verrucomicrobiae bacterium]|nr:GAF domain-containing sensor histidine kinase [Verrucomicrobiae bacterium]
MEGFFANALLPLTARAVEAEVFYPVFVIICLLAVVLSLLQIHRFSQRKQQVTRQQLELEKKVFERTQEIRTANRELKKRQEVGELLSEISTRFITLPANQIDAEIPIGLGRVAQAVNAQRANIYMPPPDKEIGSSDFHVEVTYQWHEPAVGPVGSPTRRIYPHLFPWADRQYQTGDPLIILDISEIPSDAEAERELFQKMGWTSLAIIPLYVEKRFIGNLNFTTMGEPLRWLPILVDELRVVGEIFANALERKRQTAVMLALRQDAHDAEERERTRISRELHDQLGGALSALRMQSKSLQDKLADALPELTEHAARITEIIDETLPDVRRICAELRPAILDELELAEALEWQAEQFTERTGIPCEFDLALENSIEPQHNRDVALYRITQELLTNVLRHAGATQVRISLTTEPGSEGERFLVLNVSDNGVGIDPRTLAQKSDRFGLRGVRERAEHLGGELFLKKADGGGALVSVRVPEKNGFCS